MIQIPNRSLSDGALAELHNYQQAIDSIPDYMVRVERAKVDFKNRNVKKNHVFAEVKTTLNEMCSGSRRCMYCEDSCADEVEHIHPKDLYPEYAFVWENYLYACGICNREKSNQFAVFVVGTGEVQIVARDPNDMPQPPPAGDAVLINPRSEDALRFLALDLMGATFQFGYLPGLDRRLRQRAEYTCTVLGLNREVLVESRRDAFGSYRARLREYITLRDTTGTPESLKPLIHAIQRAPHPTVWSEIKRQRKWLTELKPLFEQAPEALRW